MTASEEAEIACKKKPRTQPTNPPAKFLQWCAGRTQKTARRSGVKFGGIIQTTRKGGGIACKKRRCPQATSAPHGYKPCISFHRKMKWKIRERNSFTDCGAADQTWTGDLILTKDVLYRLSHSSVFINAQLLYWIRRNMSNEMSNKTKSRKNNLLRRL